MHLSLSDFSVSEQIGTRGSLWGLQLNQAIVSEKVSVSTKKSHCMFFSFPLNLTRNLRFRDRKSSDQGHSQCHHAELGLYSGLSHDRLVVQSVMSGRQSNQDFQAFLAGEGGQGPGKSLEEMLQRTKRTSDTSLPIGHHSSRFHFCSGLCSFAFSGLTLNFMPPPPPHSFAAPAMAPNHRKVKTAFCTVGLLTDYWVCSKTRGSFDYK